MRYDPSLKPGKSWAHLRLTSTDTYDKPWLTDVTVGECQHAESLAEAGAERAVALPGVARIFTERHGTDDLPPLMGHQYASRTSRKQTEWRCQKCGVLWETNRTDPQWCCALGGVT